MKSFFQLLLVLAALGTTAVAEPLPGWETDYMRTVATAKTNRTPVLLYFTASWCGPCKRMARTTMIDKRVVSALETVPHVLLDIDEQPILSEKHAIHAIPAFLMILPSSATVESITGFQEPEYFASWITNSLVAARKKLELTERQTLALTGVFEALSRGDPDARSKAAIGLLELASSASDELRERAVSRLNSLPTSDAPLVLQGLNHPTLAVRILAGNFLRAKLGDAFNIDPWESAGERQKAVDVWARKLPIDAEAP